MRTETSWYKKLHLVATAGALTRKRSALHDGMKPETRALLRSSAISLEIYIYMYLAERNFTRINVQT